MCICACTFGCRYPKDPKALHSPRTGVTDGYVWVLDTNFGSSARAASASNCYDISPAPKVTSF